MKDIFLFYFFSSLLPQLSNSYSRKPKDKKTYLLMNFINGIQVCDIFVINEIFLLLIVNTACLLRRVLLK